MKKLILFLFISAITSSVNAQDSLQNYTGKYVFADGSPVPSVEVTLTDGALTMGSAAGNSSLTRINVDTFQIVEFSGTAIFKRDDNKIVNAVHIEAMGYVLDGKKESSGIWIFSGYFVAPNRDLMLSKK